MSALPRLFTLSAPTPAELEERTRAFIARPDDAHAESGHRYRRVVVAAGPAAAARRLDAGKPAEVFTAKAGPPRPLVLMFPGVGDQYPGMAAGLHRHLPVFRRELDRCLGILEPTLGTDLHGVLYGDSPAGEGPSLAALFDRGHATQEIHRTRVAQPLAFAVQYALARSLLSLIPAPAALLGHSVGEYVAACLSGVLTLEDALRVVAARAELVSALPEGAMLAVMAAPGPELDGYLDDGLSIASLDGPAHTVLAGPAATVEEAGRRLMDEGVAVRRLATTHAFHSPMMEPAAAPLRAALSDVPRRRPAIPFLSNVTGTWITDEEAADPAYWSRHLCRTIRFADELTALWRLDRPIPIEAGPGNALTNLALRHPGHGDLVLRTVPGPYESRTDLETFLTTLGILWATGHDIAPEGPSWAT
ncbi:MAG TPA: acyltransferase domain-containing protein [Streptosporangiaceae bacterium]|jgi:acyl transferase domain-containing protein